MRKFKAVFLDVDGTLYRSREYEEHLLQSAVAVIAEMLGLARPEAFKRLMEVKEKVKTVSRSVEVLGLERGRFYDRLADVADVKKYIHPSAAVVGLLRNLRRKGVVIGLHTNSGRKLAGKVLECLGVDRQCYDFIVTSDDAEPKPDPSGYMLLLEKAGVNASDALYVGDRCDVELAPAKKLGMYTAAVYTDKCDYADYFLKSLSEIENFT
ncbi:MAG: HAD family hydrolase [Candidatus Caldarchaeum sp.]